MKNLRINNSSIIAITLCLLLLFVYGLLDIYNLTLESSKSDHQKKQLEIVRSAGIAIESNINHFINDMFLLAQLNPKNKSERQIFLKKFEMEGVISIFTTDKNIVLLSSEGEALPDWTVSELRSMRDNNEGKASRKFNYMISGVFPRNKIDSTRNFVFLIVIKKQDEGNTNVHTSNNSFWGCVVKFDQLIDKYLSPHRLTENDFVWVLDSEGRLIYHPHHKEMLLRSTKTKSGDCIDCHKSFNVQNSMLKGDSSVGEYDIEGEPPKIMAYAPISFQNQTWVIAISTYLPYVVNNVRNSFLIIFTLAAVFIILLSIMGFGSYNINLNRIRAIETQKHLEQVQSFQEKLHHAAKLASIGELVDSVAHEINTPAGIISTAADTLLLEECSQLKCSADLKLIKEQTRRIGKYTKSLLRFSRRLPFQPEMNDIGELINECIFIVSPKLRSSRVNITQRISPGFPKFIFDRGRMEQVIINLLNNAIDSLEPDGSINIELISQLDESTKPEGWAVIVISDNGEGIQPENINQIFDPFFSTKPLTKGTGLGLSISKAIIERHEGKLEVESIVNEGTKFIVHLPMKNGKVKPWIEELKY